MRFIILLNLFIVLSIGKVQAQKIYSVNYDYQADVKVYVVNYDYQADLKIYFVDYDYQARWKNSEKKHLLF